MKSMKIKARDGKTYDVDTAPPGGSHEVHLDGKHVRLMRKENARQMVVMGIKLPVDQVLRGSNPKGVAENRRSAMRRRAQLDDLRAQGDGLAVSVLRPVIQGNL